MFTYRIHGDNIVECERIAEYLINTLDNVEMECKLISPSAIEYNLKFTYSSKSYIWKLILLPGFNKAGRQRWEQDIFDILRDNGSFLAETPDAIITKLENGHEIILFAIEFCSALQAGNQAWQRSGRAYSTGKAGCPYIYVVDFVKYELEKKTRIRKALRFLNPIVPYSYHAFSEKHNIFVSEAYIKAEEFSTTYESKLKKFDESIFAEKEIGHYMIKKMCGISTVAEENKIFEKNTCMIEFLSNALARGKNLSFKDWAEILKDKVDIINYSVEKEYFNFRKKIAQKSHHGNSKEFQKLVERYSIGIASKDLPFGIIPKEKRKSFGCELEKLYPSFNKETIRGIKTEDNNLIVCIMKGFKGRGDDNRPDRGVLPLISMFIKEEVDILSYIYGPILEKNYKLLNTNIQRLAQINGFWKAILSLNDFVIYDSKIIKKGISYDKADLIDTTELKKIYTSSSGKGALIGAVFSSKVKEYHEDDVDTAIHYLFKHVLSEVCFEGMCNPPGGDWSGFSIIDGVQEKRWLSLPRVSKEIKGKRPDHIIQLHNVLNKPVLLSIESKENSSDLEADVGKGLKKYIKQLMKFIPSVEKNINGNEWMIGKHKADYSCFEVISAAAYLKKTAQDDDTVFSNSQCDMLIILNPVNDVWDISIIARSDSGSILKDYLCNEIKKYNNTGIKLH